MPVISVIIPTYNRPRELERALRSALLQTHNDFEIIVVDDGLRLRAESVVKNLNDERVRYVAQGVSRGSSAARNTGIRSASGEYIAFLDDTDEWLPEKLEIQHNAFIAAEPSVMAIITSGKRVINSNEEDIETHPGIIGPNENLFKNFKAIPISAQMVRRSVFDDIGYFDESLPSHQDIDMMFRIGEKHPVCFLSDKLVRLHSGQSEKTGEGLEGVERRIRGREVLLSKHEARLKNYPDIHSSNYFTLGLWYRDLGQHKKAIENFSKAFRISNDPRYFAHWILGYLRDRMS